MARSEEPACYYMHTDGVWCDKPVAVNLSGFWACKEHCTPAENTHVLTDAELLTIIGEAVGCAEDECQTGHLWKRDDVTLAVHRLILKRLAEVEGRA